MARAAHLPIAADRYESCVRRIFFRGLDLRDAPLRAQVRQRPDTPGVPEVDLQTVTNANAEGLRIVDYFVETGVPVTVVELVINETTMEGLPYSGELGDASPFAYDLQATISGRKRKLIYGEFVVLAGVTGADDAPLNRPASFGVAAGRWKTWSNATVVFDGDTAEVSVQGLDLIDSVLGTMLVREQTNRAHIEARSLLYGVGKPLEQNLFSAEATELAFADSYFREGYGIADLADIEGWETSGSVPIDGRGMLISGSGAAGVFRPNQGDVTVIVEADMPALDGTTKVLANYGGDSPEKAVTVYRTETGQYRMQLVRPGEATLFAFGPTDPSARRMRAAFTIGATVSRVSFEGGAVLTIAGPRPVELLRLWLGRLSVGNGNPLEGRITRAAIFPHAVSDTTLRQMAGGPVTDDEITTLIEQKLRTHDHDTEAHELAATRRNVELADSKTGLWSIRAADGFSGADGSALGNSEVGGIPWTSNGLVRSGGRLRHPTNAEASAWMNTGNRDGQVEADLYASGGTGSAHAALYARLNSALNQWIIFQRNADGGMILAIQFGGTTTRLAPPKYEPLVAGERFKVRFVGPRIWVFRIVSGVETLIFDVTETRLTSEVIHGLRISGGGSADNFRNLQREAI